MPLSHHHVTQKLYRWKDNCFHMVVMLEELASVFLSAWWCRVWVTHNLSSGWWESNRRYWYRLSISRLQPPAPSFFSERHHSKERPVCFLTCPPLWDWCYHSLGLCVLWKPLPCRFLFLHVSSTSDFKLLSCILIKYWHPQYWWALWLLLDQKQNEV